MRSDYALYVVAVIFFIMTALSFALAELERNLWIVTTVVLGLLFLGLGYTQRPKIEAAKIQTLAPPPQAQPSQPETPAPAPPVVTEAVEVVTEEKMGPVAEITPMSSKIELTAVKGVKAKRMEQLNAIGIKTIAELANASETFVAEKLEISPKITRRWIEDAKRLMEKA